MQKKNNFKVKTLGERVIHHEFSRRKLDGMGRFYGPNAKKFRRPRKRPVVVETERRGKRRQPSDEVPALRYRPAYKNLSTPRGMKISNSHLIYSPQGKFFRILQVGPRGRFLVRNAQEVQNGVSVVGRNRKPPTLNAKHKNAETTSPLHADDAEFFVFPGNGRHQMNEENIFSAFHLSLFWGGYQGGITWCARPYRNYS